jgi:hypothetical protein
MSNYRLEIVDHGAEIVYGDIPKKVFSYWNSRDVNDLSIDVAKSSKHPADMVFIDDYDWSSKDDIGHFEGPYFSHDSEIKIYDVSTGKNLRSSKLGEMNLPDELQENIESDEFFIDSEEHKFAFQGIKGLKGCFYSNTFNDKKFDIAKLAFSTMDVMGTVIVTGVTYNNNEIEVGSNDLEPGELSLTVFAVD